MPGASQLAPGPCTLSAAKSGNDVVLSWTAASGATGYHVYRDTEPYFIPSAPYTTTIGLTYTDPGVIGDPAVNYYYRVGAFDGSGETLCANRAGEFDFALTPGLGGRLARDDIALPLDVSTVITDAESLADWVETEGGVPFGTVKQVQKWDAPSQTFLTWSHVSGTGNNFPLQTGDYVFLRVNEDAPAVVSFVGRVPEPGEVVFSLTPGTPTKCKMNFLSLPLDQAAITNADQLADAIGTPNPPGPPSVLRARDWDAIDRRLVTWDNRRNRGTLFSTFIGYPYIVCLSDTAPTAWPFPRVDPTTDTPVFCIGQNTTVNVNLSNVVNVFGYQFQASYDNSLVSASGAFINSFFDTSTDASIPPSWNATCASGVCQFAVSKVAPGLPVSGRGTVAQLTLTGLHRGAFDLAISDDILADRDGNALAHDRGGPLHLQVKACSGDTANGTAIDLSDLTCIGGAFGGSPTPCGATGSSDINGDGTVNILDLVLPGGNYGLASPQPW